MSDIIHPLISIVIPVYNAADTLEKAVSSALSQIGNFSLEIIIIDDCSSDGSFDVAEKLSRSDGRIKILKMEKNSGAAAARNYGFSQACGEWVAVLDSDDWFEKGRIEKLLSAARDADVEIAADNIYSFDSGVNQIVGKAFNHKGKNKIVDLDEFLRNSNTTWNYDYGILQPMFSTDFIRKHSIEYFSAARVGEDYYMLLCCFVAGAKMILLDEAFYTYVQPFGSISGKPQKEGRKHYNHEFQKITNDHFIEVLEGKISTRQMAHLQRRGKEIDALICFYELKKSLQKKDIKTMIKSLAKTNFEFWKMFTIKLIKSLYRFILRA